MKKLVLFLFLYVWVVQATNQKHQRVLDHLFANSTRHIFNVDDEHFLLKMVHENNQLMYRAVYPFNKIEQAGFYKLSTKVTGSITIEVDDVTLDLNGNTVSGGIVVNAGLSNITITNGTIDSNGSFGISFGAACSNCMVSDLVVKNGTVDGISCNALFNSVIKDCTFTNNMTGLALSNCFNITVQNCIASRNTDIGFELVSSVTCCLTDCQALSTGQGNTDVQDAFVVGFSSNNGNANIFQRCIANSTQALSSTGFNSTVAGFALLGTENCSQIIECTAANAQAAVEGVTVPYGILLEATINNPITLTTRTTDPVLVTPRQVNWSPDGKYLSVLDVGIPDILIYEYDYLTNVVTRVARLENNPLVGLGFPSGNNGWSADGRYLVAFDQTLDLLFVFEFERVSNRLYEVARISATLVGVVASKWSPDGWLISTSGLGSPDILYVHSFDPISQTLSLVDSITLPGDPQSADWRPDGKFISVSINGSPDSLNVYRFELNQLSLAASFVTVPGFPVEASWSPNGKYIASSDFTLDDLIVYEFNGSDTVFEVVRTGLTDLNTFDVIWSADGQYISLIERAVQDIFVYKFDPGIPSLDFAAQSNDTFFTNGTGTSWSPDGRYFAVADEGGGDVLVYEILTFPSKNIIKDNTVFCNSGGNCPSGIGISGSSIQNLILGNTSFDNPVPQTNIEGGGPIVLSNYAFVTNIFDQNFGNAPTALQNLKFSSTDPIATPDDINIRLMRSMSKACDIQTKVDYLLTIYG